MPGLHLLLFLSYEGKTNREGKITRPLSRLGLMKETCYEIMFGIIKRMFMASLISIVNASNHTNCVWLSNQKCMISTTLTNLHPNDYSQEFHYFSFAVMLDRFAGSYDTLNELSNKVCFPNKTEDLNLSVLIMTTGVYESKTLTKPLLRECKCRFDEIKCNSDPWWNNNKF